MKFQNRIVTWITSLLLYATSSPAQAQDKPSERSSKAAPDAQQEAEVDGAPGETAIIRAKKEIAEAEQLYAAEQYGKALEHFTQAHTLMVGHPARHRVLSNIALCQVKLLRLESAIESYEKYRDSLVPADPERVEIQKTIEELEERAGFLRVVVHPNEGMPMPPITISIDGQVMPEQDEYMIPQGVHRVEMNPEGIDPQTKPVELSAKEHKELTFDLIDPYKEAKERVVKAEQLYEAGNYDAALTEFKRAFETMVGHPARPYVLYNIARCQERLYRYDAAVASYKEYLTIAGEDEADRPKVEATIESLEGFLGTIVVSVSATKGAVVDSYEVWVDGHLVGENVSRFLIPGGTHQVEIRADGFEGATQEVQVPSRDEKTATFSLAPLAKEYKGIDQGYFYTVAGLTVAAAATGTVFGVMTLTSHRKVTDQESEAITEDDADQVKKNALYADVFFITAGVLATSATILAFLTDWSSKESPPVGAKLSIEEIGIAPMTSGGYLSVGGTFSW